MLDSQAMQDGRLQIVDVYRIFENVVAIIVRLSDGQTALDAPARHPYRKTPGMMVAAVVGSGKFALTVHGSAKLARPHDQRVIQHTSLLEIEDQTSGGLIDTFALQRNISRQVVVLLPLRHQDTRIPKIYVLRRSGELGLPPEAIKVSLSR